MDDRRVADEAFRRELGERMARLEKSNEVLVSQVKEMQGQISLEARNRLELHYTLFGGPEPDKAGLLERFRAITKRDRWIIWAIAAAIGFAGKLISPLYNKWISDQAYFSVSEKWKREQSRPKIKKYTIIQKAEPNEENQPVDH